MNNNVIQHHGIQGQRWGILRYRNRDGSLTPLGKKRAASLSKKYEKVTGRKINKDNNSNNKNNIKKEKTINEMSIQELKDKTERNRVEYEYNQSLIQNGKNIVNSKNNVSFRKRLLKDGIQSGAVDGVKELTSKLISNVIYGQIYNKVTKKKNK